MQGPHMIFVFETYHMSFWFDEQQSEKELLFYLASYFSIIWQMQFPLSVFVMTSHSVLTGGE